MEVDRKCWEDRRKWMTVNGERQKMLRTNTMIMVVIMIRCKNHEILLTYVIRIVSVQFTRGRLLITL